MPDKRRPWSWLPSGGDRIGPPPASVRLAQNLREHDIWGERSIAVAQGAIACVILVLHGITNIESGGAIFDAWIILGVVPLIASSALRWVLAHRGELPERTLTVLNVIDVGLLVWLIWSYQYAYEHPAGGSLKSPSFDLLLVLVALRALRFHPRAILVTGAAALVGWAALVIGSLVVDGTDAVTQDYRAFVTSFKVLPTAVMEQGLALAALVGVLLIASFGARRLLGRAAHADDYSDALDASRRNLQEATQAKEKAEAAIAELDRREAELTAQNQRFNAALGNMPMGLCMFDQDQRLLVCNDRYIDMYGLSRDLANPGTTFRQIIEARIANGLFSGDPTEYLDERLAAASEMEASTKVQELSDGRTIAVMHEPMPQGGWVATHEDITQLRRVEQQMSHMSRHDALTDLPNRVLLRERIEEALARSVEGGLPLIVLLFDIDRFKEVNDTLGPSIGDALLQGVAQRLSRRLQRVEMIARVGGDEFVVLQLAEKPATAAAALAKKLQAALGTSFDVDDHQIVVTTTIGIAIGPSDGGNAGELLKNADLALNRAKSDGPGTMRFFERGMDQHMQARHRLERDLRSALHDGEFEIYYQPQLNVERGEITGFEALLRWNHPERGLVGPADFIPLAEETGLIVPIGEWALRRACLDAVKWPKGIKVAVNLSATQFRFGNVRQAVISALGGSHLLPQLLELEVTESVLLQDSEAVAATLDKLREIGVGIALDDFGTGYSSLSYLSRFHFDKIKIAQHFIKELAEKSESSLAILRAIVAIGASLGIATTAEGVETLEEFECVRREGCTEVQGYFISRPRPVAEVQDMLAGNKPFLSGLARRAG